MVKTNEEKLYENGKTPTEEMLEEARKKDKEEENKQLREMSQEEFDKLPKAEKKPEEVNMQTKVSIEIKLSRNYNTVTFGIQDEPISSRTVEEFREELSKKAKILREEANKELKLIGSYTK